MAITRSQQAKQMLQDGGRIGFKKGRDTDYQQRGTDRQTYSATKQQQNFSARDRDDSPRGDNKVDVGFQEALRKQKIKENIKKARDDGGFRTTGSQVYSPPTRFQKFKNQRIQNAINRNKYLALQKTGLIPGGGFKGFAGSLIDGLFGRVPENLQDLSEEELTELAFEVQKFKDAGGPINQATYNPNLNPFKEGSGLELLGRTFDAQDLLDSGKMTQTKFEELFPGPSISRDRGEPKQDPCKGPNPPAYCFIGTKATETLQAQAERTDPTRFYRIMADGGMTEDAPMIQGGLTDLAMRDEFFVGGIVKGIKKSLKGVTRAVKKVAKSPIGKAALFAAAGSYGLGLGPFKDTAGEGFLKSTGLKDFFIKKGGGLTDKGIIAALTSAPFVGELLGLNKQKDENIDLAEGPRLDTEAEPFYRLAAEGGLMRAGYQEGSKEPVAKKTMPLLDMGGQEMDLRDEGGFVPIGRMEKADDVPARLSKNEFVFTADAVRNAGDGNVDKGAEVMYNMMKNLEAGGDVSEESQGLKGAREMFQTSQRLGEVI